MARKRGKGSPMMGRGIMGGKAGEPAKGFKLADTRFAQRRLTPTPGRRRTRK